MRVHSMALAAGLFFALPLALTLSERAAAQAPFDTSTIDFLQSEFAQYLINGRHERVEIQGLGGHYYGYGAYMGGIGLCPALTTKSPEFLAKLSVHAALTRFLFTEIRAGDLFMKATVEQRGVAAMNDATNMTELILAAAEPAIVLMTMTEAARLGVNDAEALVSALASRHGSTAAACQAPETVQFVAAAEKLAVALLVLSKEGEKPYERPASLAGLPEETQRLFDEYHLCRVRTGTFYMVPGGITDPCDDDFFSFNASEARATGKPVPTRNFTFWQSSQGVVGKYEEHPYGISVVLDAAPDSFTPDIPDSLLARSGSPCKSCGAKDGWLVGGSIQFRLNYNVGRWDRIRSVTLTRQGYGDWSNRPWVLSCDYYAGDRLVREVNYWYRSTPESAVLKRLSSLPRPLPNILGVREQCPVTLTDEIKRQLE